MVNGLLKAVTVEQKVALVLIVVIVPNGYSLANDSVEMEIFIFILATNFITQYHPNK